jgi:hypothetical protein
MAVTNKHDWLHWALPCLTEKQVFDHLGLPYVPPSLRILKSWNGTAEAKNKPSKAQRR